MLAFSLPGWCQCDCQSCRSRSSSLSQNHYGSFHCLGWLCNCFSGSLHNTPKKMVSLKRTCHEMEVAPGDEQLRKRASMVQERRRGSQVVLLSPIGTFSPDVTAKAAWRDYTGGTTPARRNFSLTPYVYRKMGMSE